MTTYGDFFTGFGGATIGAKAAGLDVLFGVELEADIADVYRRNLGDHIIVADVTTMDIDALPRVDVFHASPPCTRASVANAGAEESPLDLAMAQAVVRYIDGHKPDIVTLENVYQYRNFESWHVIARALLDMGYTYNFWHVNMADYGVPQTRKRMIAIARRDGKRPILPESTHAQNPQAGLFGTKRRWIGWHEAVKDLIPMLPESQFAPWQLERLPELPVTGLVMTGNSNFKDAKPGKGFLCAYEPANTLTAGLTGGFPRALLVHGTNSNGITVNETDSPAAVVVSSLHSKAVVPRAFINGRVVKMTPRALARFQSFPDYELPKNNRLAVKGIGNAVPPLFMQRLYEATR